MHAPTTRHPLVLLTTLTLLIAGGSGFALDADIHIDYGATYQVDGEPVAFGDSQSVSSGRISKGHSLHFLNPIQGNVHATARPGFLRASVASSSQFNGLNSTPVTRSYTGGANASFFDPLVITGRNGAVLPDTVRVRITWRVSNGANYADPNSDWQGSAYYTWYSTSIENGTQFGRVTGRGLGGALFTDGTPHPGPNVFTSDQETTLGEFILSAQIQTSADVALDQDRYPTANPGFASAGASCSIEVLGIEILHPTSGALLAATVTAASGHVYPVAQPPEPWMPATSLHVTAHAINPETGSGMLCFASQAGVTYRVKASRDMGRTDPWQLISTHTGQAGATLATFIDPDAMTQSSRFFIIERD